LDGCARFKIVIPAMRINDKQLLDIIKEEIRLVLLSPPHIEVDPRDVTDAYHPSEIEPREDAWAGGDNIEDDLDHSEFETGESNAGPHDSILWSHEPGSLEQDEVYGTGHSPCEHDLTINEDKNMRSRGALLREALRLISEGGSCGCGTCSGCGTKSDLMSMSMEPEGHHDDDLPGMTHVIDMGDMDSESAFGTGYSAGQEQRDEFNYTGDISDLTPDEAIGLGYEAGVMGLSAEEHDVPHSESYQVVRQFLSDNPDMVDAAIKTIMQITGSTCKMSTKRAIVDHLSSSQPSQVDVITPDVMMYPPQSRRRG